MRTLLLPVRLALLPVRLLLLPVRLAQLPLRRRRGEASATDLADAIEELAELGDALGDLDTDEVVEAVEAVVEEAVVEEAAGRSRRSKAARGLVTLLVIGAVVCVALYLLRQRRDLEPARLVPEPEQPDLTPTDPITPVDSFDDPDADDGDGPAVDSTDEVTEEAEERAREPVAGG